MESVLKKNQPPSETSGIVGYSVQAPGNDAAAVSVSQRQGHRVGLLPTVGQWLFRLSRWETWDWRIKYFAIAPAWLWLCLRARSPWFFTASNPTLTFGGFDGESKWEMYEQLPQGSYPKSLLVTPGVSLESLTDLISRKGLGYPLCAKPDVGKMGLMFRRIDSADALREYHQAMPFPYIVQEFINAPLEVSVFYYRMPGAAKGTITGFVRKDVLAVTGDGRSTLLELMLEHKYARLRLDEMRAKHSANLPRVIPRGERYCLSPALNLSRGGRLVSLAHEKDDRLLKVFDELSHLAGTFYGRYDIKCQSVEALKAGDFSILEFNGSGAEPHHVYGNGYTFFEACGMLISHWQKLFMISCENRRRGVPYWPLRRGWSFLRHAGAHMKMLRRVDRHTPLK